MNDIISVSIPPQEYSFEKYIDENCYLVDALKMNGYKDVKVSANGHSKIEGKYYKPINPFSGGLLEDLFKKGKGIYVELIEIPASESFIS